MWRSHQTRNHLPPGNNSSVTSLFSVWAPREKLLTQATDIVAQLHPLSRIDRATAHLDRANREALERTSESEIALDGDVASRPHSGSGAPESANQSDNDMKVELVTNERSESIVFHNRPFSHPLSWLEYNRLTRALVFVLKGGVTRDFGVGVDERMAHYFEKSDRILVVLMDAKTGEPIEGDYYPLLVY